MSMKVYMKTDTGKIRSSNQDAMFSMEPEPNVLCAAVCDGCLLYTSKCPYCGESAIRYGGVGTQRAEEELEELFPQAVSYTHLLFRAVNPARKEWS